MNPDMTSWPALIEAAEAACFTDIVRKTYSGDGVIVDAGCFLGASTVALCEGLHEPSRDRPVIAIDRFMAEDHYLVEELGRHGHDVRFGESFLPVFMNHVGRHIDHIEVRAGDVTQIGRVNQSIEVLVIDLAKSPQLQTYCLLAWLSKLIPGHSVVIQQDLHSPFQPWIASAMGRLLDYFDVIHPKVGESAVFRCRSIPSDAAIRKATAFLPSETTCQASIATLQAAMQPLDTSNLDLSRALLAWSAGDAARAKQMVREVLSRPEPSDTKWRKWAAKTFMTVHASRADAFTSLLAIGTNFASL